ncbi:cold shock domain-containing protein [Streptomyces lavenduligriseus]|nr:cold shock domain-containing protein [Streptomyces lavenduligriseus]
MPDTTSADVFSGRVLEWHSEEGWGVLASDALPDRVWAHYSAIQAEGYRELAVGGSVTFSAEQAEQDEYCWRAVSVRPSWHSSVPDGGRTGKADLGFSFKYSLFDGITPSMAAQDSGGVEGAYYSSDLKISYDS